MLRSADFNDGTLQTFAVDSGVWAVSGGAMLGRGRLDVGQDAAAVLYLDEYLPVYYEISAKIQVAKPTAGWKANAYVIFDYFGPTDFKFAGIDDATNKLVIGHRDAAGWIVDTVDAAAGQARHLVRPADRGQRHGRHGDHGQQGSLTYTFPPRMIDGVPYGLNKGLVGFGSDNSRGVFDNVAVQILPPQFTLDYTENFDDGVADLFDGPPTGLAVDRSRRQLQRHCARRLDLDHDAGPRCQPGGELLHRADGDRARSRRLARSAAWSSTTTVRTTSSSWRSTSPTSRVADRALGTTPGLRGRHLHQQDARA